MCVCVYIVEFARNKILRKWFFDEKHVYFIVGIYRETRRGNYLGHDRFFEAFLSIVLVCSKWIALRKNNESLNRVSVRSTEAKESRISFYFWIPQLRDTIILLKEVTNR